MGDFWLETLSNAYRDLFAGTPVYDTGESMDPYLNDPGADYGSEATGGAEEDDDGPDESMGSDD
jgi:hypothetical protein